MTKQEVTRLLEKSQFTKKTLKSESAIHIVIYRMSCLLIHQSRVQHRTLTAVMCLAYACGLCNVLGLLHPVDRRKPGRVQEHIY